MISPPAKTTLELAKQAAYTERTFKQGKPIALARRKAEILVLSCGE